MEKQQLIDLWQVCFHDPEAFTHLFFDRVYRPENVLADEAGGRPVSALHLLPYRMAVDGREVPLSYVAGVATDPAMRGEGRISRLMNRALYEMRRRGDVLSALIPAEPWLFGFYRRWGYAPAVSYRKTALSSGKAAGENGGCRHPEPAALPDNRFTLGRAGNPFADAEAVFSFDVLFAAFDRLQRLRPFGIRHNRSGFEVILRDLFLSGGDLFAALDPQHTIRALAFVYPGIDGSRLVKDLPADSAGTSCWLARRLPALYPAGVPVFLREPVASGGEPFAMLRVIDAEQMLACYASSHPDVSDSIELHDRGLPENSGRYRLEGGRCFRVAAGEGSGVFRRLGCEALPAWLFGGEAIHFALMLD